MFGDRVSDFVEGGFETMTQNEFATMLENPQSLLELQLQVLGQNRPYWRDKIKHVHRNSLGHLPPTRPNTSRRVIVALAIAASLIAVVGINWQRPDVAKPVASANWGWLEERDSNDFQDADEYLAWISKGANAWFNKQTTTAIGYQKRLDELRVGCQQLIDSTHPPLSRQQADFLVARCKEWKKKFDRHASELETNPGQFAEIKLKTDQAIRNATVVVDELRRV